MGLNSYLLTALFVISLVFLIYLVYTRQMSSPQNNKSSTATESPVITTAIKNVSSSDLETFLTDSQLTLLDVRTKSEFEAGHLKNATNIDFYDPNFANTINQLDKDKKYLVYCRSGNRSGQAIEIMKKQGFKNILNLSGGILTVNQNNIYAKIQRINELKDK